MQTPPQATAKGAAACIDLKAPAATLVKGGTDFMTTDQVKHSFAIQRGGLLVALCLALVCAANGCTVPNDGLSSLDTPPLDAGLGGSQQAAMAGGGGSAPANTGGATAASSKDAGVPVSATGGLGGTAPTQVPTGGVAGSPASPMGGAAGSPTPPPSPVGGAAGSPPPPPSPVGGAAGGGDFPAGSGGTAGNSPPSGMTGGTGGISTPTPTGGMPGTVRATSFDFETDIQGWQDLRNQGSKVARTSSKAATGTFSLEVDLDTKSNLGNGVDRFIGVPRDLTPTLRAGQTIKYQVWIPVDNLLVGVQPFVVTRGTATGGVGRWQGTFRHVDGLAKDGWNMIEVVLPNDYQVDDLEQIGVQFIAQPAGWKGTVFIDAVTF